MIGVSTAHLGGIEEAGLLVLPMVAFCLLLAAACGRARAVKAARRRLEAAEPEPTA